MSSSNKYVTKIKTAFFFVVFFLSTAFSCADTGLPTAEDIGRLAEQAKLTVNTFMQQSGELRMKYAFAGRLLDPNDKETLCKIAKSASEKLQASANNQWQLKRQIENYQGDDWDDRYGLTGLWRKLSTDLYTTNLHKCEIDLHLALCSKQVNKILHEILAQINSLEQIQTGSYLQLLKARTTAQLARTDPSYKPSAKRQLDSLIYGRDVPEVIYFRALTEKIKLLGPTEPQQLGRLIDKLSQSSCSNDLELILSSASLVRRYEPHRFEKAVRLWPQMQDLIGSLILSELVAKFNKQQLTENQLQQTDIFEIELAVAHAWKGRTQDYTRFLTHLAKIEKFRTPLILYVTAIAILESSPTEAVELLIKASALQKTQKSDTLNVKAEEIARQAARLAYKLLIKDLFDCRAALEAFDNYSTIAGNKIDEELEYLYTTVLDSCGRSAEGKALLEKIAGWPDGSYRNRARFDLITQQIQQANLSKEQYDTLLWQLNNLIADCREQNETEIQTRAEDLYCRLLLESNQKDSAQKVLNILAQTAGPERNIFKSKALQQLGRLGESAHSLAAAIDPNNCRYADQATELLSEIIDEIEQLQQNANDFSKTIQDCKRLAEFAYGCRRQRQTGLALAEIAIFAAGKEKQKLSSVEKLLDALEKDAPENDAQLLRCRARLLERQGKFDQAGRLWAKICEIRKAELPASNRRSWKWWRAKFYELSCQSKIPDTPPKDISHTIDVLENTFQDIPPLWAEKLNSLKQQCRSQPPSGK